MGYTKERDEFLVRAAAEGLSLDTCRKLLRYASTLQRLAEAQCNGDWPYNGDRDAWTHAKDGDPNGHWWNEKYYTTCPKCEASGVAKGAMRLSHENGIPKSQYSAERVKVCPDCRTQSFVRQLLSSETGNGAKSVFEADSRIKPVFQGDPRGAVLLLSTPNYPWTEDGRGRGLYVPARSTPVR